MSPNSKNFQIQSQSQSLQISIPIPKFEPNSKNRQEILGIPVSEIFLILKNRFQSQKFWIPENWDPMGFGSQCRPLLSNRYSSKTNFSIKIIKSFSIFSKRILDENSRLRRDLEQYKAATDRVGDENALSQNEAMTCESLLEIFIRIEKNSNGGLLTS